MDNTTLQLFADNYSLVDFDKIKFDWNGQHGAKFQDDNYKFRAELCEFLIPQIGTVKLELVRDLYLELGKYSKEAWCIYNKFHILGQQLLIRGGTDYLKYYLEGASQSSDAYGQSSQVEISKELTEQFLRSINSTIKTAKDEKERRVYEGFRKRFEWIASK